MLRQGFVMRVGMQLASKNVAAAPLRASSGMGMRLLSTTDGPTAEEKNLRTILTDTLSASKVVVNDISGGCGSMYDIEVESPLFKGKRMVAQHRMVTEAIKKEIGEMHGLTIKTKASSVLDQ